MPINFPGHPKHQKGLQSDGQDSRDRLKKPTTLTRLIITGI